ncbi:putative CCA tRNA nucleotidyltransferase 1 [Gracilariopsis chorda]|uniref:Putative CCA tRNA nucleotidyltransferase 1 n=1 Tax=Gracilariopsis chorda TaxID=448386 RepID=A0A2V3J1V2_9FLOR|nr:putative CCA tRNA nucleotidyltransferase 1 [Gracilariopsis chorda]|eukprot:PXF48378.1 putative CCA tRNA nucleotidyltransferase 1 [Gracilariopsis chorda]
MTSRIPLTTWEKKVFAFLCSAAKHTTTSTPAVELRVVGGWVRDKLLGRNTNDIDIVVLHASGPQYALRLRDYAKAQRTHGLSEHADVPHVSSVIQFTPSKTASKFVDTAKVQIDGNSVDFVEVRSVDPLDSRGLKNYETSLEYDAFSRDFTINSLYYNLHTSRLEDFTNRGLEDLSKMIIGTPINPDATLRDDPLRAVRAVRFACELGFDLCQSLDKGLRDEKIHRLLGSEVSRERIGVEVVRCINSDPMKGLRLIQELGMAKAIFGYDEGFDNGVNRSEFALDIKSSVSSGDSVFPSSDQVLVFSSLIWDTQLVKLVLHEALRLSKKVAKRGRNIY